MSDHESSRIAVLEARLAVLESHHRRRTLLAILALPALAIVLAGWQTAQKAKGKAQAQTAGPAMSAMPSRFKQIDLIDDQGVPLMKLTAKGIEIREIGSGRPSLSLSNGSIVLKGVGAKSETTIDAGNLWLKDLETDHWLHCTIDMASQYRHGAVLIGNGQRTNVWMYVDRDELGRLVLMKNGIERVVLPPNP